MRWPLLFAALLPVVALADESRELVGQLGSRSALMVLHATQRADGGYQLSGEYIVLPTLARRFLEGERSPELGVTTLKEGNTAILYGRPATGELRGTWHRGMFKGMRYGPGGQERERFELSEEFPPLDGYSAGVRCDAGDGRYASTLAYSIESGKLTQLEWRSRVAPGSEAYLEPLIVDRRGRCQLLHQEPK